MYQLRKGFRRYRGGHGDMPLARIAFATYNCDVSKRQRHRVDTQTGKVGGKVARINELDREVLGALSASEKTKALLRAKGLGLKDFARKYNHWVSDVSRCLAGEREFPEIRNDLASELGWTREEVDLLLRKAA